MPEMGGEVGWGHFADFRLHNRCVRCICHFQIGHAFQIILIRGPCGIQRGLLRGNLLDFRCLPERGLLLVTGLLMDRGFLPETGLLPGPGFLPDRGLLLHRGNRCYEREGLNRRRRRSHGGNALDAAESPHGGESETR